MKPRSFALWIGLVFALISTVSAESIVNFKTMKVSVEAGGDYAVASTSPAWRFAGQLPGPAQGIVAGNGMDAVGDYKELSFQVTDSGQPVIGCIRLYQDKNVVLFSRTWPQGSFTPPSAFPDFAVIPQGLLRFSYQNKGFAPPKFDLEQAATAWLLFNDQKAAMILSPASHPICSSMLGDGRTRMASGFSENLKGLPAHTTQQSLLAIGEGINATFDTWGHAMTGLHGKKPVPPDADPILKYYGYWTDNGGAYWYNYDPARGYQGTMEDVVSELRANGIPLRYLQLDSWWYDKTTTRYDGQPGKPKNSKLPVGEWNRYGGTTRYKADPFIFPNGMAAFHDRVQLPFVTHNRWIDPASPYHDRYKISGIAAVDPGFWNEIGSYLQDNGVFCYEQDWMTEIIKYSPELTSTIDQGDAFLGNMANVGKKHGLSIQYCGAPPCCFLEGSNYDNLTSLRTSPDRFVPERYFDFLFASRLAWSMGIYPWCDVYKSPETSNIILDNLSAGPVGTGDRMGEENKENILRTIRADGVIIKPDAPILPADSAYIAQAHRQNVPVLATTYTDHHGIRTIYGVAVPKSKTGTTDSLSVTADELGLAGPAYLYHFLDGTSSKLAQGGAFTLDVKFGDTGFFTIAPVGASGIAFLGDAGKIVGTGKQRIAAMQDDGTKLIVTVVTAANESEVKLHGFAPAAPQVSLQGGTAGAVDYDAATQHFSVTVKPDLSVTPDKGDGDPVRKMSVSFQAAK